MTLPWALPLSLLQRERYFFLPFSAVSCRGRVSPRGCGEGVSALLLASLVFH